jgi:hypothetical protein
MPDEEWWRETRTLRGGSYMSTEIQLRSTFRTGGDGRDYIFRPKDAYATFGFRCARWPVPGADRAYQAWRGLSDAQAIPQEDREPIVFATRSGVGVEATRYDILENHVYVVGRSRAIAVLPREQLGVSLIRDLNESAEKSRGGRGVVVGLVTTDLDLQVWARPAKSDGDEDDDEKKTTTAAEQPGTAPAGDYILAYHDGRLQLLKSDLMGLTAVGYLIPKSKLTEEGAPPVVELAKVERNRSWTVVGLDEAHVAFSVRRRAKGGKEKFLFHAVFKTAEKSVLNVDWQTYE